MSALSKFLGRGALRGVSASFLLAVAPAFAGEIPIHGDAQSAHVASMRELRFGRVIRQEFDFSCGSAAVATLLTFSYGRPVGEREVLKTMFEKGDQTSIRKVGFSLLDMQTYLGTIGLHSDGYQVGFEKLIELGLPAITLITTGAYHHFVVLRGVRDNSVLLADSVLGLRRVSKDDFLKMWNGVLFVITDQTEIGQAQFNLAQDWAVFPPSPLARGMDGERNGLTGFYLNLPLGNEF